jgi:hypothetical protein
VPDVRGLGYAEARRLLTSAGATVDAKWFDDEKRKPLEVFGQTTEPGRVPGTSLVHLDVVVRASMIVEYVESDRAVVVRLVNDLTEFSLKFGILPRLQAVKAVRPALIGKVAHDGNMAREAASIANFASEWLTKELRRPVSIQPATDTRVVSSRVLFLGLPQF